MRIRGVIGATLFALCVSLLKMLYCTLAVGAKGGHSSENSVV